MLLTSIFHCVKKIRFYPHLKSQEFRFYSDFGGITLVFTRRVRSINFLVLGGAWNPN
jgi:hypothetical protein